MLVRMHQHAPCRPRPTDGVLAQGHTADFRQRDRRLARLQRLRAVQQGQQIGGRHIVAKAIDLFGQHGVATGPQHIAQTPQLLGAAAQKTRRRFGIALQSFFEFQPALFQRQRQRPGHGDGGLALEQRRPVLRPLPGGASQADFPGQFRRHGKVIVQRAFLGPKVALAQGRRQARVLSRAIPDTSLDPIQTHPSAPKRLRVAEASKRHIFLTVIPRILVTFANTGST